MLTYTIQAESNGRKTERFFDNHEEAGRFWESVASMRKLPDTNEVVEKATMTRSDGKLMHKAEDAPYGGICVP